MSAYLCSVETFVQIANYATSPGKHCVLYNHSKEGFMNINNAQEIAVELAKENIRSLEARYPNNGQAGGFLINDMTTPEFLCIVELASRTNTFNGKYLEYLPHFQVIKDKLSEFAYQACEHPDYRDSDSHYLVQTIESQLLDDFSKFYQKTTALEGGGIQNEYC